MIAFLKLIRYKNLLMILLTMVLTKYALIDSIGNYYLNSNHFIFLSLLVIITTASGYIVNDIFDIETDKINKPEKLYISNYISVKLGWKLYFLFLFFSVLLAILFSTNSIHYIIFFGTPILLFLYSFILKKKLLIGNFIISLLVPLPIFVVFLFYFSPLKTNVPTFDRPYYIILSIYLGFAFITTFIREIIKDIEDINGDLKIKAKTLPIVIGRKRAAKVAFFFGAILFLFLLIVLQSLKNEVVFLVYGAIFIILPLLYFLYKLWIAESKKDFSYLSNLMKIIMLFGIVSMLLFTVN